MQDLSSEFYSQFIFFYVNKKTCTEWMPLRSRSKQGLSSNKLLVDFP